MIMNHMSFRFFNITLLITLSILFLLLGVGCKDTSSVHQASQMEVCQGLVDDENWGEAISECADVENDEGWHLTAQAHMGRAGLSLFNVINTLLSSSEDGGPSTIIFGFIPETTSDANDYQSALDYLLGTDSAGNPRIQQKTQAIYLEALLVSSMLIFKDLKTLLGLGLVDSEFTTCSLDSTADNTCTFIPTIKTQIVGTAEVPEKLQFTGLGSSFYSGICSQANDPTYDGTKQTDVTTDEDDPASVTNPKEKLVVTVTNDITVDSCTIQVGSPLYYNKIASQNFTGASEISGLEVLDFYSKMDHGRNFSFEVVEATGDTEATELAFCNTGYIALPDASDDKLNDCEILAMFTDESSDIF